jgi:hypothetical protein
VYITNLVCYTYFHWFFNPECQHIFGKQRGIYFSPQQRLKHDDKTLQFSRLKVLFICYGTAVEHRSVLNRSGICDEINRCNIFLFMQPLSIKTVFNLPLWDTHTWNMTRHIFGRHWRMTSKVRKRTSRDTKNENKRGKFI